MEKKIERVPYISKWYKEEQKDELLHFAFNEQNVGSDWDADNVTTTINYCKPISPTLKYVCNLTQLDIDDLKTRLQLAMQHNSLIIDGKYNNGNIIKKDDINRIIKLVNTRMQDVIDYLDNNNDIREKCQKDQLERLEKQSKPKKSYEGVLAEHWKELMTLFEIKEVFGLRGIKDFYREYSLALKTNAIYSPELKNVHESYRKALFDLTDIANSLGIEFIEDFVKACEKCED